MREMIQDTIERILADQVTPAVLTQAWQDAGWNSRLWDVLEGTGFSQALCSADAGGAGAEWSDLYPLFAACGLYQLPLPLPEIALANWLMERGGIPHPGGIVGISDPVGRDYVPWGRHCGHILVAPRDRPDELLLFAAKDIAFEHGTNLAREPRDKPLLGSARPVATGRLEQALARLISHGAAIRAAQSAGAAQSAVRQAIQYAGERSQFGKPLAKFQAVQQQIASAVSEVAVLNAASEYAFSLSDDRREWGAAVAKVTAAEAGAVVCDVAHAVHGAIGYTLEFRLHYATQRLRSWSMEFGNHHWWSSRLGGTICRDGAAELIPSIVAGKSGILENAL